MVTGRLLRDLMPALFVFLWSSGFVVARLALAHAEPLTFLSLRFWIAAVFLLVTALAGRAAWPVSAAAVGHLAVAGLLVHAGYLVGVFYSIKQGVPAGVSALVVGLQPLLVAAAAGPMLDERVGVLEWAGLLLGFGGVALVVWDRLGAGAGTPFGFGMAVMGLLAITAGTLYQKRFVAAVDLRSGNTVQFAAAGLVTGLLALLLDTGPVRWSGAFVFALAWMVLVLSLGAISLFYLLIRRGSASRVSSLMYLTPPCTALMAWAIFGETLGGRALLGMAAAVAGVALVHWRRV